MRFVIDMNLSPRWAEYLGSSGHEAVHWQAIGAPSDKDEIVLATTARMQAVLLTHDLGFGRILALSRFSGPSTLLMRMARPTPESDGPVVVEVIKAHRQVLESGCLLVVEPSRVRVQLLPMNS